MIKRPNCHNKSLFKAQSRYLKSLMFLVSGRRVNFSSYCRLAEIESSHSLIFDVMRIRVARTKVPLPLAPNMCPCVRARTPPFSPARIPPQTKTRTDRKSCKWTLGRSVGQHFFGRRGRIDLVIPAHSEPRPMSGWGALCVELVGQALSD